MLQRIHKAGYVYNDLKLDNLLMNYRAADFNYLRTTDNNIFEEHSVNIIDFGFATRYLDKKTKVHFDKEEIDVFRGNMVFASVNQLKFYSTSRRDDLISLFYLLVFMFKSCQMPGFDIHDKENKNKQFTKIRDVKQSQRLGDLCFGNTKSLSRFMREVFSYRFKDTPRYDYLRGLLQDLISQDKLEQQEKCNNEIVPLSSEQQQEQQTRSIDELQSSKQSSTESSSSLSSHRNTSSSNSYDFDINAI